MGSAGSQKGVERNDEAPFPVGPEPEDMTSYTMTALHPMATVCLGTQNCQFVGNAAKVVIWLQKRKFD